MFLSPEQKNERQPASARMEQMARDLFPSESMSPEEYAAHYGAGWLCCSFPFYRYQDEKLDAWMWRLGEIFFTPALMRKCQEELLTPDELAQLRQLRIEDLQFTHRLLHKAPRPTAGMLKTKSVLVCKREEHYPRRHHSSHHILF